MIKCSEIKHFLLNHLLYGASYVALSNKSSNIFPTILSTKFEFSATAVIPN